MLPLGKKNTEKGFTLIELMVSVSIFSLVLLISSGSILSVLDANRKSQSQRAVMDSLNLSLESMTRTIRFGTNYHCGTNLPLSTPSDCASFAGSSGFSVTDTVGRVITYTLTSGQITRSIDGATPLIFTSPDVVIQSLTFRVFGSAVFPDLQQPQVILVVKGFVPGKGITSSSFTLETTISQRKLDFQ